MTTRTTDKAAFIPVLAKVLMVAALAHKLVELSLTDSQGRIRE